MIKNIFVNNKIFVTLLVLIASGISWTYGVKSEREKEDELSLYYMHVKAFDKATGTNLKIELSWGVEVFPYRKGSGPTVIEEHKDGSKTIALVGRELKQGLGIRIFADGYSPKILKIRSSRYGGGGSESDVLYNVYLNKIE